MLGFLWWGCFVLVGIWGQSFFPGLDWLAPGLIISLQEQRGPTTLWLAGAFILLQEGMGSLFFGSTVLTYSFLALAFWLARTLLDSRSTTLVVLLGIVLGAGHFFVSLLVLRLEGMVVMPDRLFLESMAQVVLTPILWYMAYGLFPKGLRRDERTV